MNNLEQKPPAGAVIVSGGSRGLGSTIVEQLFGKGYQVATFSRHHSDRLRLWGGDPRFYWEEVEGTDYRAVSAFVKAAEQRFGKISALVNNAAIGSAGILSTMAVTDIDRVIDTNIKAQIYLTKLVASRMLRHREGCIVNVSSINAIRGHAGVSVYSATKGALEAMTRSLAKELGSKGIRVNCVSPGYFASNMVQELEDDAVASIRRRTPLGRLCSEMDIARVVLFLIGEDTFITGQTIVIDGGFTC